MYDQLAVLIAIGNQMPPVLFTEEKVAATRLTGLTTLGRSNGTIGQLRIGITSADFSSMVDGRDFTATVAPSASVTVTSYACTAATLIESVAGLNELPATVYAVVQGGAGLVQASAASADWAPIRGDFATSLYATHGRTADEARKQE